MVGEPQSASGRPLRIALMGLAVALAIYVAASLVWPNVVPRVVLLPKPAATAWYDGCNWHGRSFERTGPVWTPLEDTTARACPEGGLPEDDR